MDIGLQFSQAFTVKTGHAVAEISVYILCLHQITKMLVLYICYKTFKLLFRFGCMFPVCKFMGLKALVFVYAPARSCQLSPSYSV